MRSLKVIIVLGLCLLLCGCSGDTSALAKAERLEQPFNDTITLKQAQKDPMLLSLVLVSQENPAGEKLNHCNDLRSIVLQQVAVGWAAEGRHEEARWAFQKGIEYARRTRQKSSSRLRGLAESCLGSGCPEEAMEAARYLRVEDRCRFLAQAACHLADTDRNSEALGLIEEAEERLESHLQAGGSAKHRAYRAIGLAYLKLGNTPAADAAIKKGSLTDAEWPPVVKIRNHLEIAEAYLESGGKEDALKHARAAASLAQRHRGEEMLVLTAEILSQAGDQALAEELLQKVDSGRHTSQAAQGFARVGKTSRALELLATTWGKSRADAISLTCSYLDQTEAKERIIELTEALSSKHRDWRLLQTVGELCAKSGDEARAYTYYRASLLAYKRDWPELWKDPKQRAFVVANFGRELAEAEVALKSETGKSGPYSELINSLDWPQTIKL